MKNKRNVIYALILPLVVVSGLVFANRKIKNETEQSPKSLSIADRKTRLDERKKWEVSHEGEKVHASHDKKREYIKTLRYGDLS